MLQPHKAETRRSNGHIYCTGKADPLHAMKAPGGRGDIAPTHT
jgi:hypothetical protein